MALKSRITDEVKAAMKAREAQRLGALRLLTAAIKQREVDERIELDDAQVVGVIEKMIKQRRDSIAQYEKGNRPDLAAQERFEIDVLSAYLPQQATDAEIDAIVAAAVTATGAKGVADMGKVMGEVKAKLAGRADMSKVSARVKAKLVV
ncbi:MAG TPA: GatB/YqeY domain-containing protein [Burkholderiales bacterium]|nr:GatB/YqeY domain-containing protein [Burkholderiales bacterium]